LADIRGVVDRTCAVHLARLEAAGVKVLDVNELQGRGLPPPQKKLKIIPPGTQQVVITHSATNSAATNQSVMGQTSAKQEAQNQTSTENVAPLNDAWGDDEEN